MKNIHFFISAILIGSLSFSVGKHLNSTKVPEIYTVINKKKLLNITRKVSSTKEKIIIVADKKMDQYKMATHPDREIPNNKFGSFVTQNKLEKFYNDLRPSFPNTEIGNDLLEITTLIEFREMSSSQESKLVDSKIKKLQEYPNETIESLEEIFKNLPSKFSNEKQQLMQLASDLDAPEDIKINLFLTEINRPQKIHGEKTSEKMALFNTTIAFRSLANVIGKDSPMLEIHIRNALLSHENNIETQRVLIHYFGRYDSSVADQLKSDYGIIQ